MNDTLEHPSPADAELGERVGHALTRRSSTGMTVDLGAVHRGARRRRQRRSGAVVVASLALVAGAGLVLAQRDMPPPAVTTPSVPLPAPDVIGAAAVLPESYGEPVAFATWPGGFPFGSDLPRIDVWQQGSTRIVVRTFDPSFAAEAIDEFEVPVSTAAEPIDVATDPRELERLASDQWVRLESDFWVGADAVTIRGADRLEAEVLIDSLVMSDGALAPASGFELVERVDAQPASTPSGWYAQTAYGDLSDRDYTRGIGVLWVGAAELIDGRDTLELTNGSLVGAIEEVDGREVFFAYHGSDDTGTSMSWIDPSGVMAFVYADHSLNESVVADVSLVTQREFKAAADVRSRRLAVEPSRAQVVVDGVPLTLRGTPTDVIACLGIGDEEQCTVDVDSSLNDQPTVGSVSALVDGEWIIAGYYQRGGADNPTPDLSDEVFTLPDDTVLPVATATGDGFEWMVIRVPAGVNAIYSDMRGDIGTASRIYRAVVIGRAG